MANQFGCNPIWLDTFTVIIDVCSSQGWATGTPIKVYSIEWTSPTTVNHTALITDMESGTPIFSETCFVAKQPIFNYYNQWFTNLYIAASGVQSGNIIITLA